MVFLFLFLNANKTKQYTQKKQHAKEYRDFVLFGNRTYKLIKQIFLNAYNKHTNTQTINSLPTKTDVMIAKKLNKKWKKGRKVLLHLFVKKIKKKKGKKTNQTKKCVKTINKPP